MVKGNRITKASACKNSIELYELICHHQPFIVLSGLRELDDKIQNIPIFLVAITSQGIQNIDTYSIQCVSNLSDFRPCCLPFVYQILTIRLNYKLQWKESRMSVNETADWNSGEINISPDNIDVRSWLAV